MNARLAAAGLWYLGGGAEWPDIADLAQQLIEPVGVLATGWEDAAPPEPPIPPEKHTAIVVKAPQEVTKQEWLEIADYSFGFRHTITASHDDTRTILLGGSDESFVKVFEPYRESQVQAIKMIETLGYRWEPHYLDDPPLDTFKFEELPTDYPVITQEFGERPDYYGQFGLPGHEGVDLRAPTGTNIYTAADGIVSDVKPVDDGHNYGIYVRVRHGQGYETTYAHLQRALVTVDQPVLAGQLIAIADDTGRSMGSHLHLTLKHSERMRVGQDISDTRITS